MTRLTPTAPPPAHPNIQNVLMGASHLQELMVGRGPNLSINIKGYYASTRPDFFLIEEKKKRSGPGHSG
jgi:hypothetical protein